jgi:DNA-binding response OmpR family regulator
MKLLLIEDEKSLGESIQEYLKKEGYLCEIANSYRLGEEKIKLYEYDAILLDITLPDGNGLDILKTLKKKRSNVGVIIISAKGALEDKLNGLEWGADDYLTKPFHLAELNARIKSIIRRRNFEGNDEIIFHEIAVDTHHSEVKVNGNLLTLTRKEYELLLYFLHNKNRVLTKESIVEHLWGDDMDMADSYDFIYTHIKNLRKKIQEKGGDNYLKTVYGMGYKFTREV